MSWLSGALGIDKDEREIKAALTSGLKLEAEAWQLVVHAIKTLDGPMFADVVAIASTWLAEAALEGSELVNGSVIEQIMHGADPFKGSRQMLEAALKKYAEPQNPAPTAAEESPTK